MGLLDDAIREHLELKRQHGASEEEIERASQEALAPARRDPSAGAGVAPLEDMPPPPPPPPADDAATPPPGASGDLAGPAPRASGGGTPAPPAPAGRRAGLRGRVRRRAR